MAKAARATGNGLKRDVEKHGQELRAAAERSKEMVRREVAQKGKARRFHDVRTVKPPARFPLPREYAWEAVPPSLACTCLPAGVLTAALKTIDERIEALNAEACRAGCRKKPDAKTIVAKEKTASLLQKSRDYLASIEECS